jgi:hypothetical protein
MGSGVSTENQVTPIPQLRVVAPAPPIHQEKIHTPKKKEVENDIEVLDVNKPDTPKGKIDNTKSPPKDLPKAKKSIYVAQAEAIAETRKVSPIISFPFL